MLPNIPFFPNEHSVLKTHSFIIFLAHFDSLINRYLLGIYHIPGTALGVRDMMAKNSVAAAFAGFTR